MNWHSRVTPLAAKLSGKCPLCPWRSIAKMMHPGTWRVHPPPMYIRVIKESGSRRLLRFAEAHDFWLPRDVAVGPALWNEYLVVFWNHRSNAHYYLRHGAFIGADDFVFDCGACEGFFARLALEAGARRVVCVEPSPAMVECLRATFEKEIRDQRVLIVPVALSSLSGSAGFASENGDLFGARFHHEGASLVPVTTIDLLCAGGDGPTLIKMDLEGSEYEALRGGEQHLRTFLPKLAVTTYHYQWDYTVTYALVRGFGYHNIRPAAATLRGSGVPRPVMLHAW